MAPTSAGNLAPATAILVVVVAVVLAAAAASQDGDALTEFRKGMSDPDGALASWDPDLVNPCTWFRVTCNADNRVIRLDLEEMNLSDHLSADLARLDQLQFMEIASNNIEGPIPPEFGNLENLISLDLCNNTISGPIPPSLGKLKSLKFMRIDHNLLTGPIPNELAGLSNLMILNVSNNDLCGTIPTSGPFDHFPPSSFASNPRLRYPGMDDDDTGR
uniref:Leucine-rich repeat-containing N-terminal plant-type domain-containing protein n=1 Tax=Oryza rufipogon TaxID=4529 RepID=A0A0E0PPB6_ORYRU